MKPPSPCINHPQADNVKAGALHAGSGMDGAAPRTVPDNDSAESIEPTGVQAGSYLVPVSALPLVDTTTLLPQPIQQAQAQAQALDNILGENSMEAPLLIPDSDPGEAGTNKVIQNLTVPPGSQMPWTPEAGGEDFYSVSDSTPNSSIEDGSEESSERDSEVSLQDTGTVQRSKKPTTKNKRRSQLKWDYSDSQVSYPLEEDDLNSTQWGSTSNLQADTSEPSLAAILTSIKEFHEEVRADNRIAKNAAKKLQGGLRRLNKTCADISDRVTMVEARTEHLETEALATKQQGESNTACMMDLMTKIEEQENRQRRNNLRLLGIPEGKEGDDPRLFIVKLLKDSFPDHPGWDWDHEVQRAHRFPFHQKRQHSGGNSSGGQPRVFLVYFGNFLLRQMIYDQARFNSKKGANGVTFFAKPDFCHQTVERRWRMRQLISPFQQLGAEVYLMVPSRLKVILNGSTKVFLSEIKAGEYLEELKLRKK